MTQGRPTDMERIVRLQRRIAELEAEVKRLTAHLHLHCHEEDATDCYYEGGGRDSGQGRPVPKEEGQTSEAGASAAANPAAPFFCPTCGSDPHEPDCPAARKEAK